MPLENATTINQLDEQWPAGGDTADRGDDHLRLIKHVLKSTFPGPTVGGVTGNGFNIPLTVDPKLLNDLATRLEAMDKAIANAHPVGDVLLRLDNVNPGTLYPNTTWQQMTGDSCLAIASAANVGTQTGANDPVVPLPAHAHSASSAGAGGHQHGNGAWTRGDPSNFPYGYTTAGQNFLSFEHHKWNGSYMGKTSPIGDHAHDITVSAAGTAGATLNVRGQRLYVAIWKRVA